MTPTRPFSPAEAASPATTAPEPAASSAVTSSTRVCVALGGVLAAEARRRSGRRRSRRARPTAPSWVSTSRAARPASTEETAAASGAAPPGRDHQHLAPGGRRPAGRRRRSRGAAIPAGRPGAGDVALQARRRWPGRCTPVAAGCVPVTRAAGLADQRASTCSTVSGATSSSSTTSRTLLPVSVPSTSAGADGLLEGVGGVHAGPGAPGCGPRGCACPPRRSVDLVLDVGEHRLVERRGADDDAERDRQEDGDQRDQVVAEVDHEKRFSSQNMKLFHWSSSRSR